MDIFCLKEDIIKKIEILLTKNDISTQTISQLFNFDCDHEESLEIIINSIKNSKSELPLLSNDNRFVQNVIMAKIFKERIQEIDKMEYFDYSEKYKTSDIDNARELELILNGHYVVNLFQHNFINLDWKEEGFISAEELFYSLGAYIANVSMLKDSREITVMHNDKNIVSFYSNYIHGDFRISQYDTKNKTMLNPFEDNELLPFGTPRLIGNLSGYHSVEHVFLTGLLALSLKEKIKLPIIEDFDIFYKKLIGEGQKFGNFGDAGNYSKSMTLSALYNINEGYIPSIPLEFEGVYKASLENNSLVYRYSETNEIKFIIYPDMIDQLISGLFEKVNVGNGRSSTVELADCIFYFKNKYLNEK